MKKTLTLFVAVMCSIAAMADYYVAGVSTLCGNEWKQADPENAMTQQPNGTWTITYTNVAAGIYEFKVTDETSWYGPAVGNWQISTAATSDITLTFDPSNNSIAITGEVSGEIDFTFTSLTVAGNNINGSEWVPDNASNHMAAKSATVYTFAFDVTEGEEYELKVCVDNSWSLSFGVKTDSPIELNSAIDATKNDGKNVKFTAPQTGVATVTFDFTNFNLTADTGAKLSVSVAPKVPTAIKQNFINGNDAPAYNLNGQRIDGNAKGFVIKNGKKYILR